MRSSRPYTAKAGHVFYIFFFIDVCEAMPCDITKMRLALLPIRVSYAIATKWAFSQPCAVCQPAPLDKTQPHIPAHSRWVEPAPGSVPPHKLPPPPQVYTLHTQPHAHPSITQALTLGCASTRFCPTSSPGVRGLVRDTRSVINLGGGKPATSMPQSVQCRA